MTVNRCSLCYELFVDADTDIPEQALEHYLEKHPDSELLNRVLSEITVVSECEACGTEFASGVDYAARQLRVPAYCRECAEANPWCSVAVTPLSPDEVVTNHVSATTPSRGESGTPVGQRNYRPKS